MIAPTPKINKFSQALKNLKVSGWTIYGDEPTNETEFLARFHKVISVDADNNVYNK